MGAAALDVVQHPLAWVREQRGWSQQELMNRLARRLGVAADRQQARRWEAGVEPRTDVQRALAAELGVDVEDLKSRPWPLWLLPTGDDLLLRAPWTMEGLLSVLDRTAGGADVDRRGFLALLTGAAAGQLTRSWARAPHPGAPTAAATADDGMVRDMLGSFEDRLALLRARDDAVGGGRIWQLLDAELLGSRALLRSGECSGADQRRLLALIGEQSRVAGWASVDAGRLAAGEVYLVQALRAAHAAGDAAAGANVVKSLSLLVLEDGRTLEALEMVQWARHVADSAPSRVQAMLAVREARIRAAMRDTATQARLVAEAAGLMSRAEDEPEDEVPAWARYFDHAEFAAQVAAGHLAAGQLLPAQERLEEGLLDQPGARHRDALTYGLWAAEISARRGDPEQAASRLADLLPQVANSASHRNRKRLGEVRALLKTPRSATLPQVRALDEQARDLLA
ncbi:transcriptional regulator [Streptacidiphilus sp. MAP5-52]|uniref:transcriptional regulator n=1 Tax=Streptacidiphilus sp. MAP5-52 TaxID=3156267 RepID=UPI003519411B